MPEESAVQHLTAASPRPLAVGQRQAVEERQAALAAAAEQAEDLAELVLGAGAIAETQEAIGQQDAHLEERRVEVEGGAVRSRGLLGAAAEIVHEPFERMHRRLGGIRGQSLRDRTRGLVDAVLRQI